MPIVSTNTGWNLLPDFVTDTDAEHFWAAQCQSVTYNADSSFEDSPCKPLESLT